MPEELWQEIRDLVFEEDLDLTPQQAKRLFVNNILQRTLAHVVGLDNTTSRQIRCSADGRLYVLSTPGGYSEYEVLTDTTAAAWNNQAFTDNVSYLDILVETNDANIQIDPATGTWGATIALPPGWYAFQLDCSRVRYQDRVGGNNADVQFFGRR